MTPPKQPRKPPVKWDQVQYRPSAGTRLVTCRCGANYLDDKAGRDAHRTVFGHDPEARS